MVAKIKIPFHLCFTAMLFTLALAGSLHAKSELRKEREYKKMLEQTPVELIGGTPEFSAESIQVAMTAFDIRLARPGSIPRIDSNFSERGLTIHRGGISAPKVFLGRSAFESWGTLGSTIAHEVEVHCIQSPLKILFLDFIGLEGTAAAERVAYNHELSGAVRFGLSDFEKSSILSTMNFYYPEKQPLGITSVVSFARDVWTQLAKVFQPEPTSAGERPQVGGTLPVEKDNAPQESITF